MNIKDYLPLYLGCQYLEKRDGGEWISSEVPLDIWSLAQTEKYEVEIKPIIRPLSDMTSDEAKELYKLSPYSKGSWLIQSVIVKENVKGFEPNIVRIDWAGKEGSSGYALGTEYLYFNKLEAEQHRWLLSKHFDLFGLIENGLAIDATQIKTNE